MALQSVGELLSAPPLERGYARVCVFGEKCFGGFPVSTYRGREFCSKLKTQKHRKASSTHRKVPIAVGFDEF